MCVVVYMYTLRKIRKIIHGTLQGFTSNRSCGVYIILRYILYVQILYIPRTLISTLKRRHKETRHCPERSYVPIPWRVQDDTSYTMRPEHQLSSRKTLVHHEGRARLTCNPVLMLLFMGVVRSLQSSCIGLYISK